MARIATLLIALEALLFTASAPAADKPHPDQFLEDGTVLAGTTYEKPFSTTHALVYGKWYRLVISGTWTLQWPADPDNGYEAGTEEDDPVYCQRKSPKTDGFPCTTDYRSQTLGIRQGDSGDHYAGGWEVLLGCYENPNAPASGCVPGAPGEWPPPLAANTSYDVTFQARHNGVISFWDRYTAQYGYGDRGYPTSGSGSYGFQLYGMASPGGSGSGSAGGGSTGGSGWHIGPARFTTPKGGTYFKGDKFRFYVQSALDATVHERLSAIIGRRSYAAGKSSGVLAAGTLYTQQVTVPTGTYNRIYRALQAGKRVVMRATFTVVSSQGKLTRYIDVPFKGLTG